MNGRSESPQSGGVGHEPAADRIAAGLARLAIALRQRSWREAGTLGLTPTQGQILEALGRREDATLGELARELGLRAATTSEAVATLAEKGLVRKRRTVGDRRRLALRLTAAGTRVAPAAADFSAHLAGAARRLSPHEQAQFLRLLVRMIRELQVAGEIETARTCLSCRFFRPYLHDDPKRPHHCGFVDAPFGDLELRVACGDHEPAAAAAAAAAVQRFGNQAG